MGATACTACPSGCKLCYAGTLDGSSNPTACTVCNGTRYLAYGTTRCVAASGCPAGQVASAVDNVCLLCDVSCLTCQTNIYTCVACKSGFVFSGSNPGPCVSACPVGQYATTTGTRACTACANGCSTCYGDATNGNGEGVQCFSCTGSAYLAYGSTKCVATCPIGQVSGVDNNCLLCDRSCTSCSTDVWTCDACSTGFTFSGANPGPCISNCPAGTYFDTSGCLACPDKCSLCFGGTDDGSGYGS